MRSVTVGANDAGKRVDKIVSKTVTGALPSLVFKWLRTKKIKLNGRRAEPSTRVTAGDVLTFYLPDAFFADGSAESEAARLALPAFDLKPEEIVYEDDNLLLLDKPQGELVQPDAKDPDGKTAGETGLVDRMKGYLYKKGVYDPAKENTFVPALCNRLDRNTCGLVIAAKNARALAVLNQKVRDREIDKRYLCVVHGVPEKKEATLKDFLYKNAAENRVYIFPTREAARKAFAVRYDDDIKTVITKYRVLEARGDKAFLEVELVTGRTHQIRAHLASIGHPLVGDGKYGVNHGDDGVKYQMLCAYSLTFRFTSDAGDLAYLDGKTFKSRYTLDDLV